MSAAAAPPALAAGRAANPDDAAPRRAFLDKYCVTCHNGRLKTAGLQLDSMDAADVSGDVATWEKVVRKLRAGVMPPAGQRRPPKEESAPFVSSLEGALDRVTEAVPNPGRPAIHRLNRAEYASAIRDLFGTIADTLLEPHLSHENAHLITSTLIRHVDWKKLAQVAA